MHSMWERLAPGRWRSRVVFGFALGLGFAGWGALAPRARTPVAFRFAISFPTSRAARPLDGRVLLFISDDSRTEPRTQSDQYRANSTRPKSATCTP